MVNIKDSIKKIRSKVLSIFGFTKKLAKTLFLDRVVSYPQTTKLLYNTFNITRLGKTDIKWLKDLIDEFDGLILEGEIDFDEIEKNERTESTIRKALQIVQTNPEPEMLDLLKNIVVNSILKPPEDDSLITVFLNYLSDFTNWHIKLLSLFSDPRAWYENYIDEFDVDGIYNVGDALEKVFPKLSGTRHYYQTFIDDLYQRGLLSDADLEVRVGMGAYHKRTTVMGDMFLAFIKKRKGMNIGLAV